MSDYRLIIKIKNGRVLRRMDGLGIKSVSELCRIMEISSKSQVGDLINMKVPARNKKGEWVYLARKIAETLSCEPEDIFNERQQYEGTKISIVQRDVDQEAVDNYLLMNDGYDVGPEIKMIEQEEEKNIEGALSTLPRSQERVLRQYFGLGCKAKDQSEIAAELGVSRARVWQIIQKALRTLREPHRIKILNKERSSLT